MSRVQRPTQEKLLRAGAEALVEDGVKTLDRGLTVQQVVQRVPYSLQTFHDQYPKESGGKATFLDDLMSSITAVYPRATKGLLVDKLRTELVASSGDPRPAVHKVCDWDFDKVRNDPATLMRQAVILFARDNARAVNSVVQEYHQTTEVEKEAYDALLALWGGELRAPLTPDSVAVILTGLVEGLTLRWLVGPKSVPDDLFGTAVVAFIAGAVDVEQKHEHVDDAIAHIADLAMFRFQSESQDSLPDDLPAAIVEAARSEFRQRGYFLTTLTNIAKAAGVTESILKKTFPSKPDIIVEALKPKFEHLRKVIASDERIGLPAVQIIERHLERLARWALDDIEFIEAFIMIIAHDTEASPETTTAVKKELNLPKLIVPTLEAGQVRGLISVAESPAEMAAILTNTLLLRCFTRRDQAPETIAKTVASMFLRGVLLPGSAA